MGCVRHASNYGMYACDSSHWRSTNAMSIQCNAVMLFVNTDLPQLDGGTDEVDTLQSRDGEPNSPKFCKRVGTFKLSSLQVQFQTIK